MPRTWTEDHGAPGLRRKFDVYKPRDGVPLGACRVEYDRDARIGADGEFVFVLRPETDAAACAALLTYAHGVVARDPQLADDIIGKVLHIREANQA